MSDSSLPPLSRAQLYKTMLKQTYQLLCEDEKSHHQLSDREQLTFIFKELADVDTTKNRDEVISIDKSSITRCNNNEISYLQALELSKKYQY